MRHFYTKIGKCPLYIFAAMIICLMASCDGSNVPCEDIGIQVHMRVHHELEWTDTLYYPSGYYARAGLPAPGCRARYVFRAYPKGKTSGPCRDFEFYRDDTSLADFDYAIKLPMGEWDIYAWQDLITDGEQPYYNVTDFAAIGYYKPYRGDTDHRDCFRGTIDATVAPDALAAGKVEAGVITLRRPAAKYVFIATDYDAYLEANSVKNDDDCSITALYATFMPSVFNNFTDLVVDSEPRMSYGGRIIPIGKGRAVIAMDYVLMNPRDSGVQVQLALREPTGQLSSLTDVITVPLRRGRVTYVEGAFLTSKGSSGINVDFGFEGDINIRI